MLGFWVLVILVLLVLLTIPSWPYSRRWGAGPIGILLVLLIVWLVLIYMGQIAIEYPWTTAAVTTPA